MSEDIQEIERLIKQCEELSDALIRLGRKLQEQNRRRTQFNQEQGKDLGALHAKLTELRSHIDVVKHEILTSRYDHLYATKQEPAGKRLRAGVADKAITSEYAAQKVRNLDVQLEEEYADLLTNSASAYHLLATHEPAR